MHEKLKSFVAVSTVDDEATGINIPPTQLYLFMVSG